VALVTVRAVVNVTAHAFMVRVRLTLGMAPRASKNCVIRRIGMTGGTHSAGVAMIRWEPGVIECCPRPCRCGVASLARGGEPRGGVIGIGGGLVVGFMARIAVRRHSRVVVVCVTICASHADVGAS
jgi:hypothetical protein